MMLLLLCLPLGLVACGLDSSTQEPTKEEINMVDCKDFCFQLSLSTLMGIRLNYGNDNAIFKCKTDKGKFVVKGAPTQYLDQIDVQANGEFIWIPKYDSLQPYLNDTAFVEAILIVDKEIKGYAVIKMSSNEEGYYTASVVKAEIFSKEELNGEQMTINKIQQMIDNCKGDNLK